MLANASWGGGYSLVLNSVEKDYLSEHWDKEEEK